MACYAMRAISVLLVLAIALCLIGTASATPVCISYDMIAGVTGKSYFWQVVQTAMKDSATIDTQIRNAIQSDLEAAAGSDVSVSFTEMEVNASAMYLVYTASPYGTTPTQDEVQATVASSATFPSLTAAIASLSTTTADISDLVPASLAVTNPLYPDPDASSSSAGYTFVSSVDYEVVVLFTGAPSAWSSVLASDRATVSADIVSAVKALMDSSKQQNDVTVTDLSVLAADADKKSMGSGSGGLVARLNIECSSTIAMTGRYLSTDEYASVLLAMDTKTLTATFQASSGTTGSVVVEETTSVAALGVSDKCDSTCKGMIAMAAVVVALAIVAVVITAVAIVCPCCCVRSPREAYVQDRKNRGAVETEVAEAIDVYGEEVNAESHAPTTVMSPTRRNSNEPAGQ